VRQRSTNRAVESLYMSDLNDCASFPGNCQQLVCLLECSRNWFFNEDMLATFECLLRHLEMQRCGNDDRNRVYFVEQSCEVAVRLDAKLRRDLRGALSPLLEESNELRVFDIAKNPDVMKAQASGAHNSNFYRSGQITTPRSLASTN